MRHLCTDTIRPVFGRYINITSCFRRKKSPVFGHQRNRNVPRIDPDGLWCTRGLKCLDRSTFHGRAIACQMVRARCRVDLCQRCRFAIVRRWILGRPTCSVLPMHRYVCARLAHLRGGHPAQTLGRPVFVPWVSRSNGLPSGLSGRRQQLAATLIAANCGPAGMKPAETFLAPPLFEKTLPDLRPQQNKHCHFALRMQYKRVSERISSRSPAIEGVAIHSSPSARLFVCKISSLSLSRITEQTPSSFKQKILPS